MSGPYNIVFSCRKNILEVPKLDFTDFNLDNLGTNLGEKFDTLGKNFGSLGENFEALSQKLRSLSSSLPQVTLPETVASSLVRLVAALHHFVFLFNTISFFDINLNLNLSVTTQINATISNFYCFATQMMEIISFSNKKTWEELKNAVNEIRKKFSSLSCTIPGNIHFRELADGRLRIYFLCAQSKFSDTLLYVDVNLNEKSDPTM